MLGGDGSFRGAAALAKEHGLKIIAVPTTIDNDMPGTDYTLGFDTAVNVALEAIDRIRDTAESHERIFFVEVMGHVCGAIALEVGVAGGADDVLVPEVTTDIDFLCEHLETGFHHGRRSSIIVVAEGGESGGAFAIAHQVWRRLRYDYRVCVLGHIQRGGTPTARDRVTGSKFGALAVDTLAGRRERGHGGRDRWQDLPHAPRAGVQRTPDTPISPFWSWHVASPASSSQTPIARDQDALPVCGTAPA